MKVQIEGKMYLESDDKQFILKEYSVVEKGENAGKEAVSSINYFTNINHAIRFILRMKIKESTAADLKELVLDIKRIEQWLDSLLGVGSEVQPRGESAK